MMRSSRKPMSPIAAKLFGLLFLVAGTAFIVIGARICLAYGYAQRHYVAVAGRVVSGEVETIPTGKGTTYRPHIVYTFPCGAGTCQGDSFSISDSGFSYRDWSQANSKVVDHAPGSAVTVYYDPADPSRSALMIRSSADQLALLLFPAIHMVVGFSILLTGFGWPGPRVASAAIRVWFAWGLVALVLAWYAAIPGGTAGLVFALYFLAGMIAIVGRNLGWRLQK